MDLICPQLGATPDFCDYEVSSGLKRTLKNNSISGFLPVIFK
jgi:hypothetical protein